ncbi:hypothetical protein [Streptosporangium sp. NPDC049376]
MPKTVPEPAPVLAVPISTGAVAVVAAPFTVEAPLGKARPAPARA